MELGKMVRVVNGLRYNTETATVLASDAYWDGSNHERHGRNTWLLRTLKGAYFTVTRTMWQGERDSLEPVTQAEAQELYEATVLVRHPCRFAPRGLVTDHGIENDEQLMHAGGQGDFFGFACLAEALVE